MPSQPPFTMPYFSIAWYVYSEHEGTKRHEGASTGDIHLWYTRMLSKKNDLMSRSCRRHVLRASRTKQPGLLQQLVNSLVHLSIISIRHRAASDEDQILAWGDHGQSCPRRLSEQSLDSVANYGPAHSLAHREAKTAVLKSVGESAQHHEQMRP